MAPRLCVVVVHSTDVPERACGALRTAAAETASGRGVALWLVAEGVRLAARGVAETLVGDGRPDAPALLRAVIDGGGTVLASEPCWRERGFEDTALVAGVRLSPPDALGALVADGFVTATL